MPAASDAEIAARLGWSAELASGVKAYLRDRGLDPTKAWRRKKKDG
jgi:hypothetical protein